MRAKKNASDILLNSVSFLFENHKFSYIEKEGKNVRKKEVFHEESISSLSHTPEVVQKLKENRFFEQKYSFTDISILTDKFTLIPVEHFEEELAETFLNHTVPFSDNQAVRFNFIPQFDLVLVFYYPEELENILLPLSQKLRITHTGFKFLSKIKDVFRSNGVFLNIYQGYFEVAVMNDEKLLLYNIYPYATTQDIFYFLEVISKNITGTLSGYDLYYFGDIENQEDIVSQLSSKFKSVNPGTEDKFERTNFTILDL